MKPKPAWSAEMEADDLFYVFVDIGKRPSDQTVSHILPSSVVAACLRDTHPVWLNTPGKRGQQHKDNDMRRLLPDYSGSRPNTKEGENIINRYSKGWRALS